MSYSFAIPCSPWSSPVHGVFQTKTLEWVTIFFSEGTSRPRNPVCVSYVSCIAGGFTCWITQEAQKTQNQGILLLTVVSRRNSVAHLFFLKAHHFRGNWKCPPRPLLCLNCFLNLIKFNVSISKVFTNVKGFFGHSFFHLCLIRNFVSSARKKLSVLLSFVKYMQEPEGLIRCDCPDVSDFKIEYKLILAFLGFG